MKKRTELFNCNLTYFILITLFVLIRIGTAINLFSFLGDWEDVILNLLVQVGFMFCISVFLFKGLSKKTYKQTFKDFRFNKVNYKSILICVAIGIIVFILNIAISSFFNFIITALGYGGLGTGSSSGSTSYPFSAFLLTLFTTAVLPGICEEVAHRGLLLNGYKELGVKKAIILSGLLFGLMHLNIQQFFYATIVGILLGFLTIMTNSIFPAMIVHFMNNGINTYLEYAHENNYFLGDVLEKITGFIQGSNFITAMLLILLVLVALVFLLIWLIYLLFKQTTGKKIKKLVTDLRDSTEGENIGRMSINLPPEFIGFNIKQIRRPAFIEKIFMYSTMILSISVTISTFIWGIL